MREAQLASAHIRAEFHIACKISSTMIIRLISSSYYYYYYVCVYVLPLLMMRPPPLSLLTQLAKYY